MEVLNGSFLPRFKVRQPPFATWHLSSRLKRQFLLVTSMFRQTSPSSYYRSKALEAHCNSSQSIPHSALSECDHTKLPELSFNRPQPSEEECSVSQSRSFGRFIAREAVLDEEYWTAAWLRAEAHVESLSYVRHAESYKKNYAEQEFNALKRRCFGQDGKSLKCFCLVTVKKKEKNVMRTVLNSVVGTLDLSIRQFLKGERYPGEIKRLSSVLATQGPFDSHKYAYVANLCVSKFARRQGIASNMLNLAIDVAISTGMKQLYVHVNADNQSAQELYKKIGFKIVEAASSPSSTNQRLLMSVNL